MQKLFGPWKKTANNSKKTLQITPKHSLCLQTVCTAVTLLSVCGWQIFIHSMFTRHILQKVEVFITLNTNILYN